MRGPENYWLWTPPHSMWSFCRRSRDTTSLWRPFCKMERDSVAHGEGTRGKAFTPCLGWLLQAISSLTLYPVLLRFSLTDLEKGIQGLIVMSTNLEEIFNCIFDAHVPPLWGKARLHYCISYPTMSSPLILMPPISLF